MLLTILLIPAQSSADHAHRVCARQGIASDCPISRIMSLSLASELALGFFSRQAAPPPPPPPPPPLMSVFDDFLSSANDYLIAATPAVKCFLMFWASVTLLTYIVPSILANFRGVQDLRKRYKADWALVTGASSGIGKALAEALAEQGLSVVLVALDDQLLQKTYQELRERFPRVEFRSVGVDLTRADGAYMEPIDAATRDIHVSLLFLNAGFMVTGFFHDVPIGKHMANLQCNAVSCVRIAHHFLPSLYGAKRPGLICFTSSGAATIPSPFTSLYSATKAFVSRFASSLAAEAGPQGIDVMAVHPSPVRSNFLAGTTNFDIINNFYKFSTGPEVRAPPSGTSPRACGGCARTRDGSCGTALASPGARVPTCVSARTPDAASPSARARLRVQREAALKSLTPPHRLVTFVVTPGRATSDFPQGRARAGAR